MTLAKKTVLYLAATLMIVAPASAQSLLQQNEQILNELRAIRQLLEKLAGPIQGSPTPAGVPPADDNVRLTSLTGPVLGKPDAPLTMVEFTDLQCPFCRQFHVTAFEQINKEYVDTGKLRYVSVDFPLEAIHPLAMSAARVARCAGDQGKFWEMRHTILVNNAQLSTDMFATLAQDLQLDMTAFQACASDPARFQAEVQKEISVATGVGVSGTPTFVIGRTSASGVDGVRLVGAQPYSVFDTKLKELLAEPASTP